MKTVPSTEAAPALEPILSRQVRELRRLLPRALSKQKEVKAVHQARVATRRLKAALDLAEPVLSAQPHKEFARALRRLRRSLGPVRDLDVMLDHLRELRAVARHGDAVRWLSARLGEQRAELKRTCCKNLSPRSRLAGLRAWGTLRDELRRGEKLIRKRAARALPVQLAGFHDQADKVTRFRARAESQHGLGPDVHELRIAGKLLRYTLELAAPLGYRLSPSVFRTFKQLQEALGLWHDFVVLGERALGTATDQMLSHHQPRLYGQVLELAQMVWKRSERHLTRFDRLWIEHGERLSAEILQSLQSPPQKRAKQKATKRRAMREAEGADNGEVAREPADIIEGGVSAAAPVADRLVDRKGGGGGEEVGGKERSPV